MLDLAHLADLHARYADDIGHAVRSFDVRGVHFDHSPDVAIMGIVNLSRDSSHRETVALSTEAAIRRGRRLWAEGARVVDIGAESTIAGHERVTIDRQREKLLPVVEALAADGILVSVETYDLALAADCLAAGAGILNLTSTTETEAFYELVAKHEAGVFVCYVQGENSVSTGDLVIGDDHVGLLLDFFRRETELAERRGVSRIWVDPGLGFSYRNLEDKTVRTRYLMNSLLTAFRLRSLGWPVLQQPPSGFENFEDEVRCGEAFYSVLAVLGGVDLVRTHEVAKVRGVVRTLQAFEP